MGLCCSASCPGSFLNLLFPSVFIEEPPLGRFETTALRAPVVETSALLLAEDVDLGVPSSVRDVDLVLVSSSLVVVSEARCVSRDPFLASS